MTILNWVDVQKEHFIKDPKIKLLYDDSFFKYYLHVTDPDKNKYYNTEFFPFESNEYVKEMDFEKCYRDGIISTFTLETPIQRFEYYNYRMGFDEEDFNKIKDVYNNENFREIYPFKNILKCLFDDEKYNMECTLTESQKIKQTYDLMESNPFSLIMEFGDSLLSHLEPLSSEYLCEK